MKLRIRGNSLRLRLTKSEVAEIGAGGTVEETVEFGGEPPQRFIYALMSTDNVENPTAVFDAGRITVFISKAQAGEWSRTNQIGIEAEKSIGAANQLTNPALDPISKIPEYKACAARIEKIHSRELPILGKNRKGASLSEVQRGK
jgi:hypothetical protein